MSETIEGERMSVEEKYEYIKKYGEKIAKNLYVAMDRNNLLFLDTKWGHINLVVFDSVDDAYNVLQMLRNVIQDIFDPFPTMERVIDFDFIEYLLAIIKKGVNIYLGFIPPKKVDLK